MALIFTSKVYSAGHSLLLIGNMTQQNLQVDGEDLTSDRHLSWGVGYLYADALVGRLTWETGLFYINRKFGSDDVEITLPTWQVPLGLRFSFGNFAINTGLYYWHGQGEVSKSEGDNGTFKDQGYNDSGQGSFIGLAYRVGGSSFVEFRSNSAISNDSNTDDVDVALNDYQIIYGFIIGFGDSSSGGDLESSDSSDASDDGGDLE